MAFGIWLIQRNIKKAVDTVYRIVSGYVPYIFTVNSFENTVSLVEESIPYPVRNIFKAPLPTIYHTSDKK